MKNLSITKERLLGKIKNSTLKDDTDKRSLYDEYYKTLDDILTAVNYEEIFLPETTIEDLNDFENTFKKKSVTELREWFIQLITQLKTSIAYKLANEKTKSANERTDNIMKIDKKLQVFGMFMIPIILILMGAAIVFTFLGVGKVLDKETADTVAAIVGVTDFVVAGVFFIYEKVTDSRKNACYGEKGDKENVPDDEENIPDELNKINQIPVKIITIVDNSKDDHSINITQTDNEGNTTGMNFGNIYNVNPKE